MDRQGRPGKRGKYKRGKEAVRELTTPPQFPVDRRHRAKPTDSDWAGYDYDFVSNPPDELNCSICLSVLRDPNLTDCCGNHFCQLCIRRLKSEGKPCPLCQEQDYTVMLDKFFVRKVNELLIKCPSSGQGCEWVGELGSIERHLDVSCGFVEVACDYCQSEDILRNSLADHKKVCSARPYRCEYCGFRDKWQFIKSVHHSECEKYPIECPNKCGIGRIQRRKLEKHFREECTFEEVCCEFEYTGCRVRGPQMFMTVHLSENVSSHLGMVASHFQKKLVEKDKVIEELQICNKTQRKHIAKLEANLTSHSKVLEKVEVEVVDMRSTFYVQIFKLLTDIAWKNQDIKMPNSKRNRKAMLLVGAFIGAAVGFIVGHVWGPVGVVFSMILGGYMGAILFYDLSETECVGRVFATMVDEKEKQRIARTAVLVVRECNLDFVEQILAKAILHNPAEARSFLTTILKRLKFKVQYRK